MERCKERNLKLIELLRVNEASQNNALESGIICALVLCNYLNKHINPLKTKRRLLYLKTQSVPRCKHFSSRL